MRRTGTAAALLVSFFLFISCWLLPGRAGAGGTWQGVDETVVEKYAKEHGREAHQPLINTGQGDLLLFAFLTAGAIGGFAAGYFWRMLTEKKNDSGQQSRSR